MLELTALFPLLAMAARRRGLRARQGGAPKPPPTYTTGTFQINYRLNPHGKPKSNLVTVTVNDPLLPKLLAAVAEIEFKKSMPRAVITSTTPTELS